MLSPDDFRPAQPKAIGFTYQGDQTLLLADVGTGKTVMLLTVLQYWALEGIMKRALVVAPKRVCLNTWMTEIDEWSHLDPKALRMGCLAGASEKKRRALLEYGHLYNVLLINYELLPWLMQHYPDGLKDFDVLVLDEVDKMKDHTTKRFKGTPRRRNQPAIPGLKDWRKHFKIHIGATGTPTPKHLLDLWAQTYLIDGGKRLGDNYYDFRDKHFYQTDYMGYKFDVLPGHEELIYKKIEDIVFRIASIPGVDTPKVIELPVRWLDLPPKVAQQYKTFKRNNHLEIQRQSGGTKLIEAEYPGVAYGKLKQISQGFAYVGDEEESDDKVGEQAAEILTSCKYAELDNLISELQGQQLLIVHHYRAQLTELQRRYGLEYLAGGLSDSVFNTTLNNWNAGLIPLLALHPASAGHGLNLDKAGAYNIVMLTMPESAGSYIQVIGRLARGSNSSSEVYVHRILMRGTIDEERDAVVHIEMEDQKDFLSAMERST